MAITYKFTINNIYVTQGVDGLSDVVSKIDWTYTGTTDDGRSAFYGGTVFLPFDANGQFTPYSDLTEEKIVSWIEGAISPDWMSSIQKIISSQLDDVKKPAPWQA